MNSNRLGYFIFFFPPKKKFCVLWKGISVYSLLYKFSIPSTALYTLFICCCCYFHFNGAEYTNAFPIEGKLKSNAHLDEISELTFGKFLANVSKVSIAKIRNIAKANT